jgi:hypothetical protein
VLAAPCSGAAGTDFITILPRTGITVAWDRDTSEVKQTKTGNKGMRRFAIEANLMQGPCVQPNECSAIADCSACPATPSYAYPVILSQVCVTDDSSPLSMIQCVEVTSSCAENPTCECVAACSGQCSDANGIGCFCVNC